MYGFSYTEKIAPHVPREQKNEELYPLTMLRDDPAKEILETVLGRKLELHRGIEITEFENGTIFINHTSYPYILPKEGRKWFTDMRIREEVFISFRRNKKRGFPMKKARKSPFRLDKVAIMFIAPAFIFYTLFIIVPTVSSVYYSFTSWDGISPDVRFIGLANYKEIFTSARFGNALKNTIILTAFISILENAFALGLALMVDNVRWLKNLFRSAFYIPVLISGIVSGFIWKIMYNYNFGAINSILSGVGLDGLKQDWLGNTSLTLIMVGVVLVWKGAGYYIDVYKRQEWTERTNYI